MKVIQYGYETQIEDLAVLFRNEILRCNHCGETADAIRMQLARVFLEASNIVQELFARASHEPEKNRRMSICLNNHLHHIFPCTGLIIGGKDDTFDIECNLLLTLFLDMFITLYVMFDAPTRFSCVDNDELIRLMQLEDSDERHLQLIALLKVMIDKQIDEQFHWNFFDDKLVNATKMTFPNWLEQRPRLEKLRFAPEY